MDYTKEYLEPFSEILTLEGDLHLLEGSPEEDKKEINDLILDPEINL